LNDIYMLAFSGFAWGNRLECFYFIFLLHHSSDILSVSIARSLHVAVLVQK
jgi:hypothetical protein